MQLTSRIAIAATLAALAAAPFATAAAQSLRGSAASVSLMHRRAVSRGLDFYETTPEIRRAVVRGQLVALRANSNFRLANVSNPYVRPTTRSFVQELGASYRRACGERLVVTSAARPMSRKLANGSAQSVHPTGIAVDLRRPAGRCLTWLRKTLLSYERRGMIEATEERRPPHFHVAVFPGRYQKAAAPAKKRTASRAKRTRR